MPKYLVETISMFRLRYVVECESAEHAQDTVSMNEADDHLDEFSQLHIDENIVSTREVTDEEISVLFFEDHPYLKEWGPEKAMEHVHKVDYGQQ